MDLFPAFIATMSGAAVAFFGGSLILKLLEKKHPEKPEHPPKQRIRTAEAPDVTGASPEA